MSLSMTALGVGDAFTARYHSTCAAIHAEGVNLLIDCPHPIRRVLADADAGLDVGDLSGVVITHPHADHVSGLEGLLFFAHFVLGRRMPVIAHPEVLQALWSGHLPAGMHQLLGADGTVRALCFEDVAEPIALSEHAPLVHGPFQIEARRTIHHIPTFALRIAAGGRTLGWSADTSFDETLIGWLAHADRFVHETNLGVHTPYERLAALPEPLRRRMWLNHYTDDFDVEASVIEPLRQGRRYEV